MWGNWYGRVVANVILDGHSAAALIAAAPVHFCAAAETGGGAGVNDERFLSENVALAWVRK